VKACGVVVAMLQGAKDCARLHCCAVPQPMMNHAARRLSMSEPGSIAAPHERARNERTTRGWARDYPASPLRPTRWTPRLSCR
jgi:hypothetical protein